MILFLWMSLIGVASVILDNWIKISDVWWSLVFFVRFSVSYVAKDQTRKLSSHGDDPVCNMKKYSQDTEKDSMLVNER